MRSLILIVASVLLGACASAPMQTARAPLEPSHYEVDHAKVAMVERQARDRWGKVVWVNLPTRRINEEPSGDN